MKGLNEFLNEETGIQTDNWNAIVNQGWKVLTYPRKAGGSKIQMHVGTVTSFNKNKIMVDIDGEIIPMDILEDIAMTNDNIGKYQSTFIVFDSTLIDAGKDYYEIDSFMGRKGVTKFMTLDLKELSRILPNGYFKQAQNQEKDAEDFLNL